MHKQLCDANTHFVSHYPLSVEKEMLCFSVHLSVSWHGTKKSGTGLFSVFNLQEQELRSESLQPFWCKLVFIWQNILKIVFLEPSALIPETSFPIYLLLRLSLICLLFFQSRTMFNVEIESKKFKKNLHNIKKLD